MTMDAIREFLRFSAVIALGLAIDMAVALGLARLGASLMAAAACGFAAGAAANFLLHRRWTFRGAASRPILAQAAAFAASLAAVLATRLAAVAVIARAAPGLPDAAVLLGAAGLSFLMSYALGRGLVFRGRPR